MLLFQATPRARGSFSLAYHTPQRKEGPELLVHGAMQLTVRLLQHLQVAASFEAFKSFSSTNKSRIHSLSMNQTASPSYPGIFR